MRVAIAASGLGHVARGIEAWAADLGRALADRGVAVKLCKGAGEAVEPFEQVVGCWPREAAETRRLLRALPRRLSWRFGLGSGYGVEQTTFALRLLRHLRREQFDLLHVQDPLVASIVQRANRLGLVRTKVILGHGTEEPLAFLKKLDYVQHLAPWHLEEAREAGVWKPTWTAIPNFIDVETFAPTGANLRDELGIPADGLVVLTAAAIKRGHKRIDYLIDEFARLRESSPQLPVWLVIAGGWEQETDALVEEGRKRLGDRVRFLVRFPRERMADLYRTGDIFVLCSLKEMMPIALLEALASGLPCLVNRHPVVEWMVGPGGEAIDMATPGALAAACGKYLEQGSTRAASAAEARRHCVENFSRDQVVDQLLAYYEFLVSHDRHPSAHTAASGHQS